MGEELLVAAVRQGDAKVVEALLESGADPDATDETGTSVLCLAVDAFDLPVVEVLLPSARLDRVGDDGRTPLLRAIDRGAYDITEALIWRGARLSPRDTDGRDALALARYWHETGAEAELRRRTGAPGPVARRTVRRGPDMAEELSLGGLTVRTGHSAILTSLEPRYGITPAFATLMSRAVAEPDVEHDVWWAASSALQRRDDPAVRDAAAALRERTDPLERCFGASVLRMAIVLDESDDEHFDRPFVDVLLPWVTSEKDPRVMRELTAGLADACDDRADGPLLALTRHSDAVVRRRAVSGLFRAVSQGTPEALAAAAARTRDMDAQVRAGACWVLRWAHVDAGVASDTLAACLDDEDEAVRVAAAAGLALRDDPRGDDVLDGLDAADPDSPYHWTLYDVWRHRNGED
ncbi:ankyrin repeat domain-containing protein [Streptomyces rimosus]|uniref:ankyrin repeat domain-containing protein n=1 Tax=Streptomyces rimosus TaxID=1927 RepID=UPI00067E3667|nr:ankyrin repeat domain-containing protein [Streptomyces rimosus]